MIMVYTPVANPVRVEPSAKTKCLESDLVACLYVQAVGSLWDEYIYVYM